MRGKGRIRTVQLFILGYVVDWVSGRQALEIKGFYKSCTETVFRTFSKNKWIRVPVVSCACDYNIVV